LRPASANKEPELMTPQCYWGNEQFYIEGCRKFSASFSGMTAEAHMFVHSSLQKK